MQTRPLLVISSLVKLLMKTVLCVLMIIVFVIPGNAYAGDTSKTMQNKPNEIVIFDKNVSAKQKSAVIEIAKAIRSGKVEIVRKFTRKGVDPNQIISFWSSVDELSNLKFKARLFENKVILFDAGSGMSSCDLIHEGNRLVIGECTFNDGN